MEKSNFTMSQQTCNMQIFLQRTLENRSSKMEKRLSDHQNIMIRTSRRSVEHIGISYSKILFLILNSRLMLIRFFDAIHITKA